MALTADQTQRLMGDQNYIKIIANNAPTTGFETPKMSLEEYKKQLVNKYAPKVEAPIVQEVPKYAEPKILPTTKGQAITGIAKGGYENLKGAMDTSEMLLKEKAKMDINKIPGLSQLVSYASKKFGIELPKESIASMIQAEVEKKKNLEPGTLLKANTPTEKIAKTATSVAALFAPLGAGESIASKSKGLIEKGLTAGKEALGKKGVTDIAEAFAPKLTTKAREGAIKSSKWVTNPETGVKELVSNVKTTGAGILKKSEYVIGEAEQEMAKRFGDAVKAGKGKVENVVANINETAKNSKKLVEDIVKRNPGKIQNTKQIISSIAKEVENAKSKLIVGKDTSRVSAWQSGLETLQESLKKVPKTKEGLLTVFRDFNKIASNIKAYEGTDNLIKQSVIAVRDGLRKELVKGLPAEEAKLFDDALLNQHWAIQAIDRVAKTGAEKLGKGSKAGKVSKEMLKYGATTLVGGGALGYGIGKLAD